LETGNPKSINARLVGRLQNMIALLSAAHNVEELKVPPNFGFHWLTGDRVGTASMTLTKNWRMTFKINAANEIIDLDLEDYH
jgi:toxin HigB-1